MGNGEQVIHQLQFRPASADDFDSLCAFRYRLYLAAGYIHAADHPQQRFSDAFDSCSTSVIAVHEHQIIGCGRMTPMSALGLPTLNYFNVQLPATVEPAFLAEMGRFMIDPKWRGADRLVSAGLSRELIVQLAQQPQIDWLLAFMSERVRQAFRPFVPFEVLPQAPLQPSHLAARAQLPGYWTNNTDIVPVLAPASTLQVPAAHPL